MTDTPTPSSHRPHLRRATVPALSAFVQGYLHQDFVAEYGSVPQAVDAFLRDASPSDRDALVTELQRCAADTAEWPIERLQDLFTREFGGAWAPPSRDALDAVSNQIGLW
jgi:hypothetical protein